MNNLNLSKFEVPILVECQWRVVEKAWFLWHVLVTRSLPLYIWKKLDILSHSLFWLLKGGWGIWRRREICGFGVPETIRLLLLAPFLVKLFQTVVHLWDYPIIIKSFIPSTVMTFEQRLDVNSGAECIELLTTFWSEKSRFTNPKMHCGIQIWWKNPANDLCPGDGAPRQKSKMCVYSAPLPRVPPITACHRMTQR